MSFAVDLFNTCFRLFKFKAILTSFSTWYSVKLELNSLNITIATLAGSIATRSIESLVTVNLASVTRSEIIDTLSFNNLESANVSFIIITPYVFLYCNE